MLERSRVKQLRWPQWVSVTFFICLSVWWGTIFSRGLKSGPENNIYTLLYPFLSLWGGFWGVTIAKKWGGYRSVFGRSILAFALGLLAQFFGQAAYAYYIYVKGVQVPYPSIGDIGYFGSVLLYLYGAILLAKTAGIKISLRSFKGQIMAVLLPLALLGLSYFLFLQNYQFSDSTFVKIFLDFGYPFGQAIYVSVALLTLIHSQKVLGGMMRWSVLFILFALVIQYLCDSIFLYQNNAGQWYVGGINDYMYTASYLVMTLSLIQLGNAFAKVKGT